MAPLNGIRVVDVATMIAGPATAMLLADLGADVIKVEPPTGDDLRYMNSSYAPEAAPFFLAVNRNKRGVIIDLRREEGRGVLRRLLSEADVVTHNYRPGVAERLGLGWEELHELNPRLIYCSITAWGETGPWARRPGIDSLVQAMAGLMSVTGEEGGRYLRAGVPLIDMSTPLTATVGILAALLTRQQTGVGSKVEASLLAQGFFLQGPMFTYASHTGGNPPRMGNRSPMALILEAHTATGGMLIGVPTHKHWVGLCRAVGLPELIDRPEFGSHQQRLRNQAALAAEIEPWLEREPREKWLTALVEAGVPCAPINDYTAAAGEEQAAAIGALIELQDPGDPGRTLALPNVPWRLDGAGATVRLAPPTLGRDTAEVLHEHGFDDAEIAELDLAGIIRGAFVRPDEQEGG